MAHEAEIGHAPKQVRLGSLPIALFRADDGLAALVDRCPHRHAPLSDGRVIEGELQCPYHGWQFAADGRCTRVPGLEPPSDAAPRRAAVLPVREQDGLVWLGPEDEHARPPPTLPLAAAPRLHTLRWRFRAECDPIDAIENFLDPVHTHFVHPGLVRREGERRAIPVVVRGFEGGVEAVYQEPEQTGFIARTFGGGIVESYGRFVWPYLAQLGYRDAEGEERLCITASFVPAGDGVDIIAMVRGRVPRGVPRWLAGAVIAPFFKRTVAQDRAILERVARHREAHPTDARFASSAADLLRPHIDRLFADPERVTPAVERQLSLWL